MLSGNGRQRFRFHDYCIWARDHTNTTEMVVIRTRASTPRPDSRRGLTLTHRAYIEERQADRQEHEASSARDRQSSNWGRSPVLRVRAERYGRLNSETRDHPPSFRRLCVGFLENLCPQTRPVKRKWSEHTRPRFPHRASLRSY